jgi:GTPase SAR1 family protein
MNGEKKNFSIRVQQQRNGDKVVANSINLIMQNDLKVGIVGSEGVGKSALLHRLIHGEFSRLMSATLGASYKTLDLQVSYESRKRKCRKKRKINVGVFDCAGQSRYEAMLDVYTVDALLILIVFDVTSVDSWRRAQKLFENHFGAKIGKNRRRNDAAHKSVGSRLGDSVASASASSSDDVANVSSKVELEPVVVLIGNKVDLADDCRRVAADDVRRFADTHQIACSDVSALSGLNVKCVFDAAVEQVVQRAADAGILLGQRVHSDDAAHSDESSDDDDDDAPNENSRLKRVSGRKSATSSYRSYSLFDVDSHADGANRSFISRMCCC